MSIPGMVLRKLLSVFRFVSSCLKSLFGFVFRWRSRSSNIGELPYTMPVERRGDPADNVQNLSDPVLASSPKKEWHSWNDESFGIESKIAEYRQQRQLAAACSTGSQDKEPDFFSDMQPQLKPTKKLKLRDNSESTSQNLFEVREGFDNKLEAWNSQNLGELETNIPQHGNDDSASCSWDDSALIDDSELDALEREQRRVLREAKHKERIAEHERRLAEKRRQAHNPGGRGFAPATRSSVSVEMP